MYDLGLPAVPCSGMATCAVNAPCRVWVAAGKTGLAAGVPVVARATSPTGSAEYQPSEPTRGSFTLFSSNESQAGKDRISLA